MSTSEFDADTAVAAGASAGEWVGQMQPRWNVGPYPNGGYSLALAARAMLAAAGRPDPLSITAHYVAPRASGPATVATEVVRQGRRYATVGAALRQEGRDLVRCLGAFGDLTAQQGPTRVAARPPELPPPERCVTVHDLAGRGGPAPPEVMRRYDLRVDPGCEWLRTRIGGHNPGTALEPLEIRTWIRFADGAPPSVLGLVAMADAFPPTLLGTAGIGWIPTVELTVHVRGRPEPGWLAGTSRTRFLINGVVEQDGEWWDAAGRLVVLCRQLAMALPADPMLLSSK